MAQFTGSPRENQLQQDQAWRAKRMLQMNVPRQYKVRTNSERVGHTRLHHDLTYNHIQWQQCMCLLDSQLNIKGPQTYSNQRKHRDTNLSNMFTKEEKSAFYFLQLYNRILE
eukprot:3623847-Ditylum_brightwellii.AAC.1